MPMKTIGPGLPRRAIAIGTAVVLVMAASYVVLGREHIAALGASAYPDPTLTFTASRSAGPSGSVIHLAGAPAGALAEFSGEGVRAYSPTFVNRTGVAAIVPPIFRGSAVGSGDVELRLLAPKGPIWTSSAKTTFRVEGPTAPSAPLGIATLFALEVTQSLLTNAADAASTAAAAGAPGAVSEHKDALTHLRLEVVELAKQFELVAWGNKDRIVRSGLTIDSAGVRLMDELMRPYFAGPGVSANQCQARNERANAGLAAQSAEAAKAAAILFVRSVVDCRPEQVRELARYASGWTSTLGYTAAEALRTDPELPRLASILQVAVMSWTDEAIGATYLWKQYGQGETLRSYMLERNARPALPDSLYEAAKQNGYLSAQLERLRQESSERELIESFLEGDAAVHAGVVEALEARQPMLATPSPPPILPIAVFTTPPREQLPSPIPGPAGLSYAMVNPPAWAVGTPVAFSFCVPMPASPSAPCGEGSLNPKGGKPPLTFTYIPPRPAIGQPRLPSGLTFHPNGLVTGAPTTAGLFTFDVCVKDSVGGSVCHRIYGAIN